MMEHLPGIIAIVGSVLVVSIVLLVGWIKWKKYSPSETFDGVGMIYLENSVKPWVNWRGCVLAVRNVLRQHEELARFHDFGFWVEVIPYNKPLRNSNILTGWTIDSPPYHVSKPKNEEEAVGVFRVVGSVKTERFLPFTKKHYVIQLVQERRGDSNIDLRLMAGEGPVITMDQSAFFYEVAKRLIDFVDSDGKYFGDIQVIEKDENELELEFKKEFLRVLFEGDEPEF